MKDSANRQFLIIIKMVLTKNKNSIPKCLTNRKPEPSIPKPKRVASMRPTVGTNSKGCLLPNQRLPPLRATIQVSKCRQQFLQQRRKSTKGAFDQRIIVSRQLPARQFSQASKFSKKQGLSKQVLLQRKQSHLNTYFNLRKNKLKEITKENKRIYVRLNSQKSLYSSRQLDKSCDSSCSISRRSSQSRLSRASSINSTANRKKSIKKSPPKPVKIYSQNINHLEGNQINRYLNIFCNHLNLKPSQTQKNIQTLEPIKTQQKHLQKQNKILPPGNRLQQIIQQFDNRPKRKAPFLMARIF